jgi:chromosome segregation ATPase
MGRVGVDFQQVSSAALELIRRGQPVTVDNVRIELGGTGSKSTIAPLLKRWRTEQEAQLAEQPALPQYLLQSVQRLFGDVEQRFKTEQAAVEVATSLRLSEASAQNSQLRDKLETSEHARHELNMELEAARSRIAGMGQELAAARAELRQQAMKQVLLEQRDEDRSSEVNNLRNQLTQVTRQLDHFQTTSQQRWDQEKLRHESKLDEARRSSESARDELGLARQQLAAVQAELALLNAQHEELGVDRRRLQSACDDLRQNEARLEEAARQSELSAKERLEELANVRRAYDGTVASLSETEKRLAVSVSQVAMLETSLAAAGHRAEVAQREHLAHLRQYAEVEAELRYCRRVLEDRA